ncbi:MAG: hypothetical protein ACM3NR_00960, partial [Methanosarcina sp.]
MKKLFLLLPFFLITCSSPQTKEESVSTSGTITGSVIISAIDSVRRLNPSANGALLEKGVKHAASLWRNEDGTAQEFITFAKANFISDPDKRKAVFNKVSRYFESIGGNMNEITLDLKKNIDEAGGEIDE